MKKNTSMILSFALFVGVTALVFAQSTKPAGPIISPATSTSQPAASQPVKVSGSEKTVELRVAAYNILRGEEKAKVFDNIHSAQPDIVLMEEAPDEVVRAFARKLDMSYNFGPYTPNGSQGIAILTKGKIKAVRLFSMQGERNFALASKVTIKGQTLLVIGVHLKSLPRPVTKGVFEVMDPHTRQAAKILAEIRKHDLPVLVGGDCNMLALSPEYAKLTSVLSDVALKTPNVNQPTIFVHAMGYRIDYFFTWGPWQVADYGVSPKPGSDHRMIHARLKLECR
jgi:endonuclease/exonuclease/phosphatase (EEP) superfamily protein YafD